MVKLPPSACVMKPARPGFSGTIVPSGTITALTSRLTTIASFSWLRMSDPVRREEG